MYTDYLQELTELILRSEIYEMGVRLADLDEAFGKVTGVFEAARLEGRKVFFIGNGGSAAIAIHATADFLKNGRMRTVSLYDAATLTCLSNDFGYEYVFEKQLAMLSNAGDLLVAISSSGESENILRSAAMARERKMKVVTFTGFCRENRLLPLGDYSVYVPVNHYGMTESIHQLFLQEIADALSRQNTA